MSIKRRSVLYTKDGNNPYRFLGWAMTVTTLGSMMEPFNIGDRHVVGQSSVNFDMSDEIARVDELQPVSPTVGEAIVIDSGTVIHGGDLMPRTTIRTGNF